MLDYIRENKKAWNYHKKKLHSILINYGKQLHHIFGREGRYLSCLRFMVMLRVEQHQDKEIINKLVKDFQEDRIAFEENYNKFSGCMVKIFDECHDCYFKKDEKRS